MRTTERSREVLRQPPAVCVLAFIVAQLAPVDAGTAAEPQAELFDIKVKPGHYYDLTLPPDCGNWTLDILRPVRRKRFIIKCDDLASWSLGAFQRFARLIEKHDAKAGLGIIPGQCQGDEVFEWIRTLDPDRFEIWNHTWTHGKNGPNHYQQPYDVQWRNLGLAHETVREKTGIVMHTWCGGGIKYQGKGVHDQDDVTHQVIRDHPEYKVHFHAAHRFADRGYGVINSDGIFMPWRHSWFENEGFRYPGFVDRLRERWPSIDWDRPTALGNAQELKWRFDHPFWHVPESGEIDIMVGQFHPTLWDAEKLAALGELLEHIKAKRDWQFANAYDTYKWLIDEHDIVAKSLSPGQYRLDARLADFEHLLQLDLPPGTKVHEHQAPDQAQQ